MPRVRATVSRNKVQKLSLRGEVGHSPRPVKVTGTTATVEDCYDISAWNPVSAMVAAVRDLFGNPTAVPRDPSWPLRHPVFSAVLGCLVLLAVMIPLALRLFQAKTTD